MYKLINDSITNTPLNMVKRIEDNTFIPFDPANTDYQQFKKDLSEGASLKDA